MSLTASTNHLAQLQHALMFSDIFPQAFQESAAAISPCVISIVTYLMENLSCASQTNELLMSSFGNNQQHIVPPQQTDRNGFVARVFFDVFSHIVLMNTIL